MPVTDAQIASFLLSLLQGQQISPHAIDSEVLSEAVKRGHKLAQTPGGIALLSTDLSGWRDVLELSAQRNKSIVGKRTAVYRTTRSTNDACWSALNTPDSHGMIAIADEQTGGRGRRGNPWHASPGQSLLFSCLLKTIQSIEQLTLLAGLATAKAIEKVADIRVQIKWPNDVLISGRKVSGILVERRGTGTVIGVGINVLQALDEFPYDLQSRATSLYIATRKNFDRLRIAEELARQLDIWCANTPPAHWLDEWKSHCEMLGQRISLRSNGHLFHGTVADIDPQRGIVLRGNTGEMHFLPAAVSTVVEMPGN